MKLSLVVCLFLAIIVLILASFLLMNALGQTGPLTKLSSFGSSFFDKPSPHDAINENDIKIYPDRIVIFINNASLTRYTATKSMDPTIDSFANGIEIPVSSTEQIQVGDIIVFKSDNELIAHRVIKIGQDEQGWFCITKGDNALENDGKIRFYQIKSITIAVIY
jgi:hypothetical protein